MIEDQRRRESEQLEKTGRGEILLNRKQIKELRTAETVVSTAIHPDTGHLIPWPMRLSSFIIMNLPISFGMVVAAPTTFNTIFWQWVNQSYNAALNYGNRNASSSYTSQDILKSYSYACASSITVALGLRKMLESRTKNMRGAKVFVFNTVSTFFACSTAGFLNAYCMRQTELEKGIDLVNPSDPAQVIGKSQRAAKKAVMDTAISRYILCLPLFLPSFVMFQMEKKGVLPLRFWPLTLVQMSLFFIELYIAVPFAIAIYPQVGTIKSEKVEKEFREWRDSSGQPLSEFQYNKGL
uniref:Sideroflexin n=1 Tax=Strombidium rassoulzadegani TaxID=1082188 RepID=A0A7S3CLF2_9SPIT|mmetsp:Transcript_12714/g.21417  ORF Transcript_12714/g.21417 Transcript_12714/m.21417 type:complete len:295 (+) Transcript_12714:184-1068(+)